MLCAGRNRSRMRGREEGPGPCRHHTSQGVHPMSVSDSVSYQQLCLKTAAGAACALLLLGSGIRSASAAAQLVVEPITWDVIGLDHNAVNTGPNEFPVGARVRNIGDEPATNVTVQF